MLPIYRPHSNPSEAHYTFLSFFSKESLPVWLLLLLLLYIYIYTHTTSIYPFVYMHTHRERERGMLLRVISPKHFSLTWTSQVYWLVCETLLSVNHSDLTRFIRLFFFFFSFQIARGSLQCRERVVVVVFLWPFSLSHSFVRDVYELWLLSIYKHTLRHSLVNVWIDFISIYVLLGWVYGRRAVTNRTTESTPRKEKRKKKTCGTLVGPAGRPEKAPI